VLCVAAATASTLVVASEARAAEPTCTQETLSVKLSPLALSTYHVSGVLCLPTTATDTVQLLVPGLTYDHTYWDFGYEPETYSYARRALAAGYATFAVDRIGTGQSSRPPALNVTIPSGAYVMHQVISALRGGQFSGVAFAHVVYLGHSGGSAIGDVVASTYRDDVDAFLVTGWLHTSGLGTPFVLGTLVPAQLDPVTSVYHAPLGYMTLLAGTRGSLYNTALADPGVLAHDEATKDTITAGELDSIGPALISLQTRAIDVPVLLVVGGEDALFCGVLVSCNDASSVIAYSRPFYSGAPLLDAYVAPGSGHNLNLHTNAPATFTAMLDWIEQHMPA
jgi:pimeloyl-ACP methyl ester carboxylesterase